MMRGLVKILEGTYKKQGIKEIKKTIQTFQLFNGLIKDDKKVKSFQYHSFMLYILFEAYINTNYICFKNTFIKGIKFICNMTLNNGDNNYIGRGQEQIFGFGPLLYSLEKAYDLEKNIIYKIKQRNIYHYLLSFKRSDGSFPLVLRKDERGYPYKIDVNDVNYLGWYSYNNYFDYLSFLAFF